MNTSQGLLCSGDFYLERLSAQGVGQGLIGPLNTTKLEIKPTSEDKTRNSTKKSTFGQALDSVQIPGPTEIAITLDDQPADILEMALQGVSEIINVDAGTITAESVTLIKGRWVEFSLRNVTSTGLVITDSSNADAPLVVGDDVEINYQMGMIKPIVGGAVEDGGDVKITASSNAYTGTRIKGGTTSNLKYRVILDGENLVNGKAVKLTVGKCSLMPNNGTDFMAGEFVSTELTGKIEIVDTAIPSYILDELSL